jgi:hypothetical protein
VTRKTDGAEILFPGRTDSRAAYCRRIITRPLATADFQRQLLVVK